MRKGPAFNPEKVNCDFMVEWNDDPKVVLEAANTKLKLWNLEFVVHETHSSTYAFSIQPIPRKK